MNERLLKRLLKRYRPDIYTYTLTPTRNREHITTLHHARSDILFLSHPIARTEFEAFFVHYRSFRQDTGAAPNSESFFLFQPKGRCGALLKTVSPRNGLRLRSRLRNFLSLFSHFPLFRIRRVPFLFTTTFSLVLSGGFLKLSSRLDFC